MEEFRDAAAVARSEKDSEAVDEALEGEPEESHGGHLAGKSLARLEVNNEPLVFSPLRSHRGDPLHQPAPPAAAAAPPPRVSPSDYRCCCLLPPLLLPPALLPPSSSSLLIG